MKNFIKQIKKSNTKILIHIFYMMFMFNFILNRKMNCFIISIATTLILYFIVKKNIEISMLISLMLSIFVFTCNKVIEYDGEEDGGETSDNVEKEDSDDLDADLDADLDDELDVDQLEEDGIGGELTDDEKLEKAIQDAQRAGIIEKTESAEEQRKKEEKRLDRKFKRCASASLKPINVCRQEINNIITGEDDEDETSTDIGVAATTY